MLFQSLCYEAKVIKSASNACLFLLGSTTTTTTSATLWLVLLWVIILRGPLLQGLGLDDLLIVRLLLLLDLLVNVWKLQQPVEKQEEYEGDLAYSTRETLHTLVVPPFQVVKLEPSAQQTVGLEGCHESCHREKVRIGVKHYHVNYYGTGLAVDKTSLLEEIDLFEGTNPSSVWKVYAQDITAFLIETYFLCIVKRFHPKFLQHSCIPEIRIIFIIAIKVIKVVESIRSPSISHYTSSEWILIWHAFHSSLSDSQRRDNHIEVRYGA